MSFLEELTVCCGRIYRAKFLKWGSVEYSVSIPTAPAPPTADTNCKNIPLNFCLEDALSANKNHHSFDHKYFALIYLISGGDGSISVGSTKTFTENWVAKQSFFVLILTTAKNIFF